MIEDAMRVVFWAIAKLFLSASDWMYDMLNAVVNLNLAGSNEITYTWLFFLSFLLFATFVRVGYVLLRKTANEDEEVEIGSILKKLSLIHISEPTRQAEISYAVFCLKKKKKKKK